MTDIDIVVSEIRAHAYRVKEVASQVDTARAAAGQVSLNREPYGVLCSPLLVPVLGGLEGAGIAGIGASALTLDGTALALNTMATSLEAVDQIASDYIRSSGRVTDD